ncbi:hypothetical protein TCAL_06146 [Tigriopus californicus]|uniref:Uncharacterized protein n=1 Tax=Tigriopus californicus TaxID=6832 RepID=A0A553PLL5_TIGCA|nr:uncharacterized protein LOC131890362 [Tigriopus californicus]XP_059095681.1 uncharacterized protein LOC131890362 [Tigriopus californicus]TRY78562.1 hypothetical protein TCAL_06146 [Tigriopus californicus]|eukprot:TCALIF_06146-PA protein Name:"Protein of unknown function" AED:0.00 eAED:0.00 QI:279/1/1/1/0.66/0.75/4/61/235
MHLVTLSKVSILFFVGSVTFWYMVTPYIVQPHPGIMQDVLTKTSLSGMDRPASGDGLLTVENWTKWRLFVNGTGPTKADAQHVPEVIFGNSKQHLNVEGSQVVMNMEYRPDYVIHVQQSSKEALAVERSAPTGSGADWGIYNHFIAQVSSKSGKVVQVVPRFLFGMPFDTIETLYGTDVSKFPIVGVFTNSTRSDRFIIQIYMNLVTLSVIFLLYANNPPESIRTGQTASPKKTQ